MSAVETEEVAPRQEERLPAKKPRHPVVNFLVAGSATSCASVLSNPVSSLGTILQFCVALGSLSLKKHATCNH